jgi:PAS domain S-box-containing protein
MAEAWDEIMVGEVRANHNSLIGAPDGREFRKLAENIPALCFIADATGYITWYNPRWYEYTGKTPLEMQGWGWQSVHDPKSLPEVLERWTEAISSAKPFEMVIPIRGADGIFRPFLTRINPAFDDQGSVTHWFGVNTDISLQLKAEDAALKSESRFRVIADSMPQMVWSSRADGYYDYFNARWYEFTGVPNGSADGNAWQESVHPDDRDRASAEWLRSVQTGTAHHIEYRLRDRSGNYRWVLARGHAERDSEERIARWYGTYTDIEDIVQARSVLQRSRDELELEVAARTGERNLLATLVETTDVMVMAVDLNYVILAINKANADEFERIYGVRARVGDNLLALLAGQPEQLADVKAAWSRGIAGEEITLIEAHGNPSRSRRFYEIKFRPLRNDAGERIGAYQFVHDVTERLRDQAKLKQAQDALLQSQKLEAMGQLTGGVAHDFNNLLTPIMGSLDMLQRRDVGDLRERRLIHAAYQSAERAKILVQRLLAFARRQPLQPTAIDVSALIHGLKDLIASTIGPQVMLHVDAAASLPHAKADPNQLELAILNLAVNSRDAIDGGGTIGISAVSETIEAGKGDLNAGRYVRIRVADSGRGMDEGTLARAVEPFFSTKGVGKGTGLGLSMVHGLASQLGGALTIESRPGAGTQVSIWLPESEAPITRFGEADEPQTNTAGAGDILLVDDEEFIRLSTAIMLTELGFKVHEAQSAEAALQALDAGLKPDLLITDHLMPGMTGVELARELRTRRPDAKVLIVSGFADVDGIDPCIPRLTKPFLQSELAAAMAELIRR